MTSILLASLLCAVGPAAQRARAARPAPAAPSEPAPQLSDDEIRERIETYLGTIDTAIGAQEWRALGPRAVGLLEQIAQDGSVLPTRRAKALDGLAAIGSRDAPDLMMQLAKSEHAPLLVRLAAVRGVGQVLPSAQVVPALQPLLETAQDGHVRKVAAEVLSRHGGCGLVRAQARREDEPARMQRALDRCGE